MFILFILLFCYIFLFFFFFFNDTATTEIYTLSLHDALPISFSISPASKRSPCTFYRVPKNGHITTNAAEPRWQRDAWRARLDRKSTRLNSSHGYISYAVFCLKKKNRRT